MASHFLTCDATSGRPLAIRKMQKIFRWATLRLGPALGLDSAYRLVLAWVLDAGWLLDTEYMWAVGSRSG